MGEEIALGPDTGLRTELEIREGQVYFTHVPPRLPPREAMEYAVRIADTARAALTSSGARAKDVRELMLDHAVEATLTGLDYQSEMLTESEKRRMFARIAKWTIDKIAELP